MDKQKPSDDLSAGLQGLDKLPKWAVGLIAGVLALLLLPEFLPAWAFNTLVIGGMVIAGIYGGAWLRKRLRELKTK